jgi:hypothetical protein
MDERFESPHPKRAKSAEESLADESQEKILKLLDTLALEIGALRTEMRSEIGTLRTDMSSEIGTLRTEMCEGFERVERRLGNVETRVGNIEAEQRSFRREFERRIAPLEL